MLTAVKHPQTELANPTVLKVAALFVVSSWKSSVHPWEIIVCLSVLIRFTSSYQDKGSIIGTGCVYFGLWILLLPLQRGVNCLQCLFDITCKSTEVVIGQERGLCAVTGDAWLSAGFNGKYFKLSQVKVDPIKTILVMI